MDSRIQRVFSLGTSSVKLVNVEAETCKKVVNSYKIPPKPLLIASPDEEGEYPVILFLHGYLLYNSFYSQLFQHLASHGFIVIGPQLYVISGADTTKEVKLVAELLDWLTDNLTLILPMKVKPNLTKICLAGHSRGGKVAFALAQDNFAKSSLKISALIAIDPVDGMEMGKQTPPPILKYVPNSLKLEMPVLVIGSGLGELKANLLFPPAAPKGVSHEQFFNECCAPVYYFVAKDYGHVDMLDDETKGFRGKLSYLVCKNGKERKPMRLFVGGVMVAFLKARFEDDNSYLIGIKDNQDVSPVKISKLSFVE